MAIKKIPCGGWLYDDEQITFEDGVMKVIGGGGDIPPEVTNAIETNGMGWTDSEEVPAIDIEWDGDTEGLDKLLENYYRVSDIGDIDSKEDFVGATYVITSHEGQTISFTITQNDIDEDDGIVQINNTVAENVVILVTFEENEFFTKGIWFINGEEFYISRLYKEASTKEVVHKIDEKYIPSSGGGGGMVVKVTADPETFALSADKTFAEIKEAFRAGVNVVAKTYVGEEFDGASASCISCGEIVARFGMVLINEETSGVMYELECSSEDGIDKWSGTAF